MAVEREHQVLERPSGTGEVFVDDEDPIARVVYRLTVVEERLICDGRRVGAICECSGTIRVIEGDALLYEKEPPLKLCLEDRRELDFTIVEAATSGQYDIYAPGKLWSPGA
jgi:hypothetical protein